MANILTDYWEQIKIQWYEWRVYQRSIFNVKRDKRQIERAIHRAILRNSSDGRTYYILKNIGGGFDEVNSNDLKILRAKNIGYFPRYQDYNTMIRECFAIVTSNVIVRNSYVETINNINKYQDDQERQKNH